MSKLATRPKRNAPSKSELSAPSSQAGKGGRKSSGKPDGPRRLRVGVTLFLREGGQSLWENGIFQNCYFLLMLLERSPLVEKCFIINGGPGDPKAAGDFLSLSPAPVISLDEAMDTLDLAIELSAQFDIEWIRQFGERGGHTIAMHVANDFVLDMERMVFDRPPAMLMSRAPYDRIWTLPAFEETCASYYRAGFHAPVQAMQHLWSPLLLERTLSGAGAGRSFAYVPGRKRWRLAVMEPNICMVKTCHLPILLSDLAYRRDPGAVEALWVYNAMELREHSAFTAYARSMDLVQHGIASFEPRVPVFEVLGPQADALVSHHWHNAQNYLYYEALYGGFPLIHNSHLLDGCGYAYRTFDPEDGALALLQALASHDRNLDSYRADARRLLARLDPCSDANVASYTRAMAEVCGMEVPV